MMQDGNKYTTEEQRWLAVESRDEKAENAFRYGVQSTGVYCRPGCSTRLPRRENVTFFDTWQDAEAAGYRPCKRCAPDTETPGDRTAALMAAACRRIEQADVSPTLKELAADAGMSPSHFQRRFKRMVGITPKQYSAAMQSARFRDNLEAGMSVTDAMYAAGYGSTSRGYAATGNKLSMKPGSYKKGGAGESIRYGLAQCSLGWVIAATTQKGLCAVEFDDDPDSLRRRLWSRFPKAEIEEAGPEFDTLLRQVVDVVDGGASSEALPLDIRGTAFQVQVWQALRGLTPGETATYTEIAARIGRPEAVRAVAGAVAANPLAVVVPCHRVLRKDGGLGGYRWGEDRKRRLLKRESAEQAEKHSTFTED